MSKKTAAKQARTKLAQHFVNKRDGMTKFCIHGDKKRIFWKDSGEFYREELASGDEIVLYRDLVRLRRKVTR